MRLKVILCACLAVFAFLAIGCGGGAQQGSSSLPAISLTANNNTPLPGSGNPGAGNPGGANPGPPAPSGSVNVTTPADAATVTSPFQVTASASASTAITAMHVYVDGRLTYQTPSSQIDTSVNAAVGPHVVTVQAWDQSGQVYSVARNVTVSGSANDRPPTFSQIQRIPNWDHCSVCAGQDGSGPPTDHSMDEGISSPSLSGAAARFYAGGTPWGAALWWKQVGGDTQVRNLKYDLDFYVERPDQAQALEFDVNQNTGGRRYIYGTECDFGGSQTWRVWNSSSHNWISTGVYCGRPEAGRWNHVTWEFQRDNQQVVFVAVTLNGDRHSIDRSFSSYGEGGEGLDVAFQADLNSSGGNLLVWVDNVNLTIW